MLPNTVDASPLLNLEKVIERGMGSFIEVGNALLTIRTNELYKETHRTWEEYCMGRWGWKRHYVNRIIGASRVANAMVPTGTIPISERSVRPLTALPKEKRVEVWKKAVDSAPNGEVTERHVREAIAEIETETKTEDPETKNLPIFKKPERGWALGSQAMLHASAAIRELSQIATWDPKRPEAFNRVMEWMKNQTEGGKE
jgi:hypothetical protein